MGVSQIKNKKMGNSRVKPLKFGLNAKVTFCVGALMSLSLVLMGGSFYFNSIRLAETQALDLLLEQQERYLDEINSVLKHSKSNVLTFASTPPIKAILRANEYDGVDPVTGDSNEIWVGRLTQIANAFLENYPTLYNVALLNNEGKVLAGMHGLATETEAIGHDVSQGDEPYHDIQAALKLPDKTVYHSDIERDDIDDMSVLTVSTPIYLGGQAKGVVLAEISVLPMLNLASRKRKGIETYIVDSKGRLWVKPNNSNEFDLNFLVENGQKSNYTLINEERQVF